jgi:hypothetical protein
MRNGDKEKRLLFKTAELSGRTEVEASNINSVALIGTRAV